jgi:Flp pilus assembly pilin Flp
MRFFKKVKKETKRLKETRAQMTIEYAVMFTVICSVIIYASTAFIRPAVNRFYNSTQVILDNATTTVQERFSFSG